MSDFKRNFLNILKMNLYKNYDYSILNENINIHFLYKNYNPEKYQQYIELCRKNNISYLFEKTVKDTDISEKDKKYFEENKTQLKKALDEFLITISERKLDLDDIKVFKIKNNNFKYYDKYLKEMEFIANHSGIIMVDTLNNDFADILVLSYILNNKAISILTDDFNKKENLKKYLNENYNFDSMKKSKSDEIKEEIKKVKDEKIKLLYEDNKNDAETLINIINKVFGICINSKLEILEEIILKLKNYDASLDEKSLRLKFRETSNLEEKEEIKKQLKKSKISNFSLNEAELEYLKSINLTREEFLNHREEILNLYNSNDFSKKNEKIDKKYDELSDKLNEKIIEKDLNIFTVMDKKISETVLNDSDLLINNIEKYDKYLINKYISNFNKVILVGDFEKSNIFNIYKNISVFEKLKIK